MQVLLIIVYVVVWTLALFAAVGLGHNLTARRDSAASGRDLPATPGNQERAR